MAASAMPEAPIVLVKWYDYAKWVLEQVDGLPDEVVMTDGVCLRGDGTLR